MQSIWFYGTALDRNVYQTQPDYIQSIDHRDKTNNNPY